MASSPQSTLLITCAPGLEAPLTRELLALGLQAPVALEQAVAAGGDLNDVLRICLLSRIGHRVLWPMSDPRPATTPDHVYQLAADLPWEDWISPREQLTVTSNGSSSASPNLRFLSLKVKDAIVDRMRKRVRKRPESGSDRSGAVVHAHFDGHFARLYLDGAGTPLSHRGYRLIPGPSPMRETLAAGCLSLLDWTGEASLSNPMCGSGTIAIEAACISRNIAPGLLRQRFAAETWLPVSSQHMRTLRHEAKAAVRARAPVPILASDHSPQAVHAARANARRAGVENDIAWETLDFRRAAIAPESGLIFLNPEYGVRLGAEKDLDTLYREIGKDFKARGQGKAGAVFTGNLRLAKQIGLSLNRKWTLWNGDLECRLLEFLMHQTLACQAVVDERLI
ncbi:MAG TPA: class I SAM-dependent RNA methyltransferase [Kiritimatiellia bacterium]|nr:class I SAM-dependent RNA methyltransferase [Kiritimatiellia bacterium]